MQLAGNAECRKSPKSRHLRTIVQLCQAVSLQLRHVSTIGKKLLSSNVSPTCPHNMVNFGPLAAEIVSLVWGTQVISTGLAFWLRYCSDVAQRKSPNFARCLAVSWVWYREWNYGTFADGATYIRLGGHHVWHRPTF